MENMYFDLTSMSMLRRVAGRPTLHSAREKTIAIFRVKLKKETLTSVAREMNISESTVRGWRKNWPKITSTGLNLENVCNPNSLYAIALKTVLRVYESELIKETQKKRNRRKSQKPEVQQKTAERAQLSSDGFGGRQVYDDPRADLDLLLTRKRKTVQSLDTAGLIKVAKLSPDGFVATSTSSDAWPGPELVINRNVDSPQNCQGQSGPALLLVQEAPNSNEVTAQNFATPDPDSSTTTNNITSAPFVELNPESDPQNFQTHAQLTNSLVDFFEQQQQQQSSDQSLNDVDEDGAIRFHQRLLAHQLNPLTNPLMGFAMMDNDTAISLTLAQQLCYQQLFVTYYQALMRQYFVNMLAYYAAGHQVGASGVRVPQRQGPSFTTINRSLVLEEVTGIQDRTEPFHIENTEIVENLTSHEELTEIQGRIQPLGLQNIQNFQGPTGLILHEELTRIQARTQPLQFENIDDIHGDHSPIKKLIRVQDRTQQFLNNENSDNMQGVQDPILQLEKLARENTHSRGNPILPHEELNKVQDRIQVPDAQNVQQDVRGPIGSILHEELTRIQASTQHFQIENVQHVQGEELVRLQARAQHFIDSKNMQGVQDRLWLEELGRIQARTQPQNLQSRDQETELEEELTTNQTSTQLFQMGNAEDIAGEQGSNVLEKLTTVQDRAQQILDSKGSIVPHEELTTRIQPQNVLDDQYPNGSMLREELTLIQTSTQPIAIGNAEGVHDDQRPVEKLVTVQARAQQPANSTKMEDVKNPNSFDALTKIQASTQPFEIENIQDSHSDQDSVVPEKLAKAQDRVEQPSDCKNEIQGVQVPISDGEITRIQAITQDFEINSLQDLQRIQASLGSVKCEKIQVRPPHSPNCKNKIQSDKDPVFIVDIEDLPDIQDCTQPPKDDGENDQIVVID